MISRAATLSLLAKEGIKFTTTPWKGSGYHGTSRAIALRIAREGFNWSLIAPKRRYGHGVYFYIDDTIPGFRAAICHARDGNGFKNPAVIKSDLQCKRLLDVFASHNSLSFTALWNYLRRVNPPGGPEIDEKMVAEMIGHPIAGALDCDGIGASFFIREPKEKIHLTHRQAGICVAKPSAIRSNVLAVEDEANGK